MVVIHIYVKTTPISSLKFRTFVMILVLIISAVAILFVIHAEADDASSRAVISGQCGSNATYILYSDGTLEIAGSGEMYQYNDIPAPWYNYREDITEIVISDNITKLGASAFLDCEEVRELTIPITLNSVVSDSHPAFYGCYILKVNFTSGNGGYGYDYATYEGSNSWYKNTPWYSSPVLLEINFANGIKGIGSDAFRELQITSIVIPDSVVHLGNHCFYNCEKLSVLTIPVSLNSFGSDRNYPAFNGCMAIQKVTLTNGNGVPFDYSSLWGADNCDLAPWNMNSNVTKTIIIGDNVTKLGAYMFLECNIKELTLPISLDFERGFQDGKEVRAFTNLEKVIMTKGTGVGVDYNLYKDSARCPWIYASNLKSVIIEEGVTRIGSYTFYDCNIENLTLPNTLVSFGRSAFYNCTIKTLTIPINVNATWLDSYPAFEDVSGIEKIDFTPGSGYGFMYAAYKGSNCWYQLTPWYQCRDTLKEINFAEGIKSIGSDAFRELHLTSIVIPNSVESLSNHTFFNMTELSSLTIPITLDSVASNKYPAFQGCVNIEKIRFTGSGDWFAYSAPDLQPSYYGYTPWQYSKAVLKTVDLSYGVASIGRFAFEGCTSLGSITIPLSVKSIGDCAFSGTFYDADGVTAFEKTASCLAGHTFNSVDGNWIKQESYSGRCGSDVIYEFDTAAGVLTISGSGEMDSCFSGNAPWFSYRNSITTITIGDTITSIGDYAFEGITRIDSITIPDSVTNIGKNVFKGCTSLASFVVSEENCAFTSIDGVLFSDYTNTLFQYPAAKVDIAYEIPDSVTIIKSSAFRDCTYLASITIPYSVGTIEADAFDIKFYDTDKKTELEPTAEMLADSTFNNVGGKWIKLAFIKDSGECGENATYEFDASTGILIITGSGSMASESYGLWPWDSYKAAIRTVLIKGSVETIGFFAFKGCTALSSITIADSVTSIGASAFEGCTSLTSITIPDSVKSIGNSAFRCCTSFKSLTPPDSVTSIGSLAFDGCTSLTSIILPNSVTSLGDFAFKGCTSLTYLAIPDSVTSFGEDVFDVTFYDTNGEKVLESTTTDLAGFIFKNIEGKLIKQKEFGKCGEKATYELDLSTGALAISGSGKMESYPSGQAPWYAHKDIITSIVIGDDVTSIGDFAFEGCTKVAIIKLGKLVDSIGEGTFNGCSLFALYNVSTENSVYASIDGVLFSKDLCTLIQYPVAKAGTSYKVPDSVTIIKSSAFNGHTFLTSIIIPDTVTTIENGAFDVVFYYPDSEKGFEPTTANLAGSILKYVDGKWIKQMAFGKCGDDITYELDLSIGDLVILGSGEMRSYPSGGAPWFSYKNSINSIRMAESITSIGNCAFEGITFIDSILIPDSVRSIGAFAFEGCTKLSTVYIGSFVRSIGASAFEGCTLLSSYVVSNENKAYCSMNGVLFDSDRTTLIQYPPAREGTSYEILNTVSVIKSSAFKGCTSLTSLTIPESIETIESGAFDLIFYDSDGKTKLDQTVEILAGFTFNNNEGKWIKQASTPSEDPNKVSGECGDGITYELVLSTGTLTISGSGKMGSYSSGQAPWYAHKDTITSIVISDDVTSIGEFAFEGCTLLSSYVVSDENNVYASIDDVLFSNDKSTLIQYPVAKAGTSYEIPASVKTIASSAFNGCTSLTSIIIPDSVETIEAGAFDMVFHDPAGEKELEPSVENLVGSTFNKVDGKWIKQASTPSENPNKVSGECGDGVTYELDLSEGTLTINGSGQMGSYSSGQAPWFSHKDIITSIVIGDDITSIGDFAFEGISSIGSITIPDSVESIGASAFAGCSKLSTVKLGKLLDTIEDSAFNGCSSLASYVVSENNGTYVSIDGVLFSKDKLTLIQYPVAKAGTSYEIPDTVTTIASSAFIGCKSLTSITIPDSVTTIEAGAFDMVFHDPEGEKELEQTVENLAGSTFNNIDGKWIKQKPTPSEDPNKVSGECGEGVTYDLDLSKGTLMINGSGQMGSNSSGQAPWFSHKDIIKSVVIADSVRSIGDFAFEDCTELATVKLGNSVNSIGEGAFNGCISITTLTIPDSVETIGASAFAGCTGLKELTVPTGIDCVGSNEKPSFSGCVNIEKITFAAGDGNWYHYNVDSSQSVSLRITSRMLHDNVSERSNYEYTPWQLSRSTLTTVIINDGVTSIGYSAFKDCTALASVTLPDSVTSIGENVFNGCISLTTFNVSENSSKYCFVDGVLYNKDMTELILCPAGNTNTSFEIPASVKNIASSAFDDCKSFTSITIPYSIETIGDSAFDVIFYDTDGETELEQTVENLAGSTFDKISDKWIKQSSASIPVPSPDPSDTNVSNGSTMIYLLIAIVAVICLSAAVMVVKKRRA